MWRAVSFWCAVACVPLAADAQAAAGAGVPNVTTPLAGCGDDKLNFAVTRGPEGDTAAAPDPTKATIYFVEVSNLHDTGRFGRPILRHAVDAAWVGATQGFTFVSAVVDPGTHHLCSRWQSHFGARSDQISLFNLDAAVGHRYYFRIQISVQGHTEGGSESIDLQPVSEDEGRFLVSEAAQALSKPKS